MYRVLLPLDTSESRTAAQVDAVASLPGADGGVEATLLHVFDDRETADALTLHQRDGVHRVGVGLDGRGPLQASRELAGESALNRLEELPHGAGGPLPVRSWLSTAAPAG